MSNLTALLENDIPSRVYLLALFGPISARKASLVIYNHTSGTNINDEVKKLKKFKCISEIEKEAKEALIRQEKIHGNEILLKASLDPLFDSWAEEYERKNTLTVSDLKRELGRHKTAFLHSSQSRLETTLPENLRTVLSDYFSDPKTVTDAQLEEVASFLKKENWIPPFFTQKERELIETLFWKYCQADLKSWWNNSLSQHVSDRSIRFDAIDFLNHLFIQIFWTLMQTGVGLLQLNMPSADLKSYPENTTIIQFRPPFDFRKEEGKPLIVSGLKSKLAFNFLSCYTGPEGGKISSNESPYFWLATRGMELAQFCMRKRVSMGDIVGQMFGNPF